MFSTHGFLSTLHTRGLLGLWEVSKRPDLFYLLHPSSVWRNSIMKTWPPPPMSLTLAVFATEKSQCAPATSLFSCRGWVYHPSSDGWLFPEKIKVSSVPKLLCEKDAIHSVYWTCLILSLLTNSHSFLNSNYCCDVAEGRLHPSKCLWGLSPSYLEVWKEPVMVPFWACRWVFPPVTWEPCIWHKDLLANTRNGVVILNALILL